MRPLGEPATKRKCDQHRDSTSILDRRRRGIGGHVGVDTAAIIRTGHDAINDDVLVAASRHVVGTRPVDSDVCGVFRVRVPRRILCY